MNVFISIMKKVSFGIITSIIAINIQAAVSPNNSQLTEGVDEVYESQLLSDQELTDLYAQQEAEYQEQEELNIEATESLAEYLVEMEEDIYIIDIPTETYNELPDALKNIVDASVSSYNKYLTGEFVSGGEGYLIPSDGSHEFSSQDGEITFEFKYTRVWFVDILTGVDIIAKKGVWSIVMVTIFALLGTAALIYDILSFDTEIWGQLSYIYTGTLWTIASQVISMVNKIPSYLVTGIILLLRSAKTTVAWWITAIRVLVSLVFPPLVHSMKMIDGINAGKTVRIKYDIYAVLPVYNSFVVV